MHIYVNYSVKEIIEKIDDNIHTPEIDYMYTAIETYRSDYERRVERALHRLWQEKPENAMRWIHESVDEAIRPYVIQGFRGEIYNVLMRNETKWKTISDIGILVEEAPPKQESDYQYWKSVWEPSIERMKSYDLPFFETHAHYNLPDYDKVRTALLTDLLESGVKQCVVPSIEYDTIFYMRRELEQYDFIKYAFGSHPKYIYKENWTQEKWEQFSLLLEDKRCVALGEVGLDYSYVIFDEKHREIQMNLFDAFVKVANEKNLPMILHIRPAAEHSQPYDVNRDAMQILRNNEMKKGAVFHCFGGSPCDVREYMDLGITHFGIGGRLLKEASEQLEQAVFYMPEEAILLETDSPYIRVKKERIPNTSFALVDIAQRIAQIRGISVHQVINLSFRNACQFFGL